KQPERAAEEDPAVAEALRKVREILEEALALPMPNFFAMGYYLTFSPDPLPEMPVNELNAFMRRYLDEHFMLDFIATARGALEYSHAESVGNKRAALGVIGELMPVFEKPSLDKAEVAVASKKLVAAVEKAIDRLEIVKDNAAYTFASSLKAATALYFAGI